MTSNVQIAVGHRGDWTLLTVSGEIDMATAAELTTAGDMAEGDLVLDLSEVSFIDSSGLGALLQMAHRPGRLIVVASPPVRRLFDLTRVEYQFTVVDILDEVTW